MKMRKNVFVIAMLAALVLLSGCLDIEEDIVINEDGSGSYRIAMIMDASLADMMEEGDSETMIDEGDFEDAETKTYTDDDGNFVSEATVNFDDLETFIDEFNESSEDGGIILEYEDLGGTIRLTHIIEGSDSESGGALGDTGDFGAEMLEGLEWKLSITVPSVVDTNGELDEETNTVTWEIPLTLLSEPDGHEAFVEYSTGSFNWSIAAIAIGCCFGLFVLAAIVVGIFFFVRSRNKKDVTTV